VKSGCKLLRNTVCLAHGPATRRAGLFFINESVSTYVPNAIKLIPFNFSTVESRVLEFYNEKFRVIKDDAYVVLSIVPATYSASVDYVKGDLVRNAALDYYCLQPNGPSTAVKNPATEPTYWMVLVRSGDTSYVDIPTPYTLADLPTLWYKQSRDVIYIASPNHPPAKISRYADDNWIHEEIDFLPITEIPTGLGVTATITTPTTNKRNYRYLITAINAVNGEESLVSDEIGILTSILSSSKPNYNTLWWWRNSVDPLEYRVYKYDLGVFGYIGSCPTYPQLFTQDSGPPSPPTETVNLTIGKQYILMVEGTGSVNAPTYGTATEGAPLVFTASAASENFTVTGSITRWQLTSALLFDDDNIAADVEDSPPDYKNPFVGAGNYPSIVFFWSQRLGWAAPDNFPFTHWLSPKGLFESLAASTPTPDPDDSIEATLAVEQANRVQWVEGDRVLISGTTENEWALGKADEPLLPDTADFFRKENVGSEGIPPLLIGSTILFVQRGGDVVQEISYSFTNDSYKAKEISIVASHLLDGRQIMDWCYQKRPYSVVWMILDDNSLVGMTYMPEHEVIGWHRHDTYLGGFGYICCSNGGSEDIVTLSVVRVVDGALRRYNERLDTFFIKETEAKNAFFVDSGVKFDIFEDTIGVDLTLDSLSGTVVATVDSGTYFETRHIFQELRVVNLAGEVIGAMTITSQTGTTATGTTTTDFTSLNLTGGTWGVYGVVLKDIAYHLRGETVKVWADGAEQEEKVVGSTGTVTLDLPAEKVAIGLQMISDVIPTRPELATQVGDNTTLTKKYKISTANLRLYKSMAVKVGKNEDQLEDIIARDAYDPANPQLVSGDKDVSADTGWDSDEWEFLIRADGPAPMTLSAIVYDVEIAEDL
jgi:hypothetical protein